MVSPTAAAAEDGMLALVDAVGQWRCGADQAEYSAARAPSGDSLQ
jgi:hypothetical protein